MGGKLELKLNHLCGGKPLGIERDAEAGAGRTEETAGVTANNGCGSSTVQTLSISVINTVPDMPSSITGDTIFCDDVTIQTYSIMNDTSATFYTWTLPSGWIGTSTTNSINVTSNGSSGSISVTATNSCGTSSPQTLSVIVNPLPSVSLTLSDDTLCIDDGLLILTGESPSGGTFSGAGVTGTSFDPNVGGAGIHLITYSFTDTNTCTNTTTDSIFVDLCLGMKDTESGMFSVFPNPSSGIFTINCAFRGKEFEEFNIEIYNVLGEIIYSSKINSKKSEITLNKQQKGIYFVEVKTSYGKTTKKIIIQ